MTSDIFLNPIQKDNIKGQLCSMCIHASRHSWLKINVRKKQRSSLSRVKNNRIMKYKAANGKDHMDLPQNNAVQY